MFESGYYGRQGHDNRFLMFSYEEENFIYLFG